MLAKLHAAVADHLLALYDVDTSAKLGDHALSLDDGLVLSGSRTGEISAAGEDATEEDNDALLIGRRRHDAATLVWLSYYSHMTMARGVRTCDYFNMQARKTG